MGGELVIILKFLRMNPGGAACAEIPKSSDRFKRKKHSSIASSKMPGSFKERIKLIYDLTDIYNAVCPNPKLKSPDVRRHMSTSLVPDNRTTVMPSSGQIFVNLQLPA